MLQLINNPLLFLPFFLDLIEYLDKLSFVILDNPEFLHLLLALSSHFLRYLAGEAEVSSDASCSFR